MTEVCGIWPPLPPERPEIPAPWTPEQPSETPWQPRPQRPSPPAPLVPDREDSWPGRDMLGSTLLRRRIVLVTRPLTEETAALVAAQIMTLDAEDDGPIQLHITSPDGDLGAALMLADTVYLAAAPVTAFCRGILGGPALAPFAAAERRLASAHATFRLSEPRTSLCGRVDEIAAHAAAIRQQLTHLHVGLAEATGQPSDKIAADMEQGRVLTAHQARDYGLVHEIARAGERSWLVQDRGRDG